MRKATIKDVAQMAGVCTSTVSRVLSGGASISEETCQRVRDAAKKLHYMPNTAARSLRCEKSRSIGVIFPDISGEFYASCASSLLRYARAQGYAVLFTESGKDREAERGAVGALMGRCVDGMIFIGDNSDAGLIRELSDRSIPIVTGDRVVSGIPSVTFNNRETVCGMVEALYRSGHKRFVYIGQTIEAQDNLLERFKGYMDALAKHPDAEPMTVFEKVLHKNKLHGAYDMFRTKIMSLKPDAIIASHDLIAQGVLHAAHGLGIRVPGDIAVTGFDDMLSSEYFIPSITTVRQDTDILARKCFETLVDLIEGRKARSSVIRQRVIWRDSAETAEEWKSGVKRLK